MSRELAAAIKDAGWPTGVLAKQAGIDVAHVQAFLEHSTPMPRAANEALQTWLGHKMGRASDGLLYVDPYRPVQVMPPIIAAPATSRRRQ